MTYYYPEKRCRHVAELTKQDTDSQPSGAEVCRVDVRWNEVDCAERVSVTELADLIENDENHQLVLTPF